MRGRGCGGEAEGRRDRGGDQEGPAGWVGRLRHPELSGGAVFGPGRPAKPQRRVQPRKPGGRSGGGRRGRRGHGGRARWGRWWEVGDPRVEEGLVQW